MLEIVLYIVCFVYALEYLFFGIGLVRNSRRYSTIAEPESGENLPDVSVVVAARNEEENIVHVLQSLLKQDYPKENVRIIAVNDDSDDQTLRFMTELEEQYPERLHVLTTSIEATTLRGKSRAIAQGIDQAIGKYVLLTDADCIAPPTWIRSVVALMEREEADVYSGFTVVDGEGAFAKLQQLDWLHLQAIASSSMAFNSPVGAVGNNMAFTRAAYEQIGGYRRLPFSITEDFSLFLALIRSGARAIYPCSRVTSVRTRPIDTLQNVLRQKHRWGRGGIESTPHGYSILVIAFFMLCSLCIAPFVSPVAWGVVWGVKFLADFIFLFPVFRELKITGSLNYFLPFQFYFLAQSIVVPVMLVNPNVSWKGRVFDTVTADSGTE